MRYPVTPITNEWIFAETFYPLSQIGSEITAVPPPEEAYERASKPDEPPEVASPESVEANRAQGSPRKPIFSYSNLKKLFSNTFGRVAA